MVNCPAGNGSDVGEEQEQPNVDNNEDIHAQAIDEEEKSECLVCSKCLDITFYEALAIEPVTCSTHPTHHPQTFQPLLDQLESWNLAHTLTRPI